MLVRLLKLEVIYIYMGNKFMVCMLFFEIALPTMYVLYTVHDTAPCTNLYNYLDNFMVDLAHSHYKASEIKHSPRYMDQRSIYPEV